MTHTYTPPASAQALRLVAAWTNWEFPPFSSPPELAWLAVGPEEVLKRFHCGFSPLGSP